MRSASSAFKPHQSSLARYAEDSEEEDLASSSGAPSRFATTAQPDRRSSDGDHVSTLHSSRCNASLSTSADRPRYVGAPASSRTSTASSAAAFSLRSLSNRGSTGSVSSSASSVISRGESDRIASADSTESHAMKGKPARLSSSSSPSVTAPSSPARTAATEHPERDDFTTTEREDASDTLSEQTADSGTPGADQSIASQPQPGHHPAESQSPSVDPQASSTVADDAIIGETAAALQTPFTSPTTEPQRVLSPVADSTLTPSAEELLSSAGANVYSPLVPRRHSGMIMLRSRSQLAMHAGLTMTFASADGGRAAARERARKQTGWENAPFSVLEAQRHARSFAFSQPASPGGAATASAWDPSAPASLLQPAASVIEQAAVRSPKLSPRPLDRSVPSPQSSPLLPPSSKGTDAPVPPQRPAMLSRQKSDHTLSRTALGRIDTLLGSQIPNGLEPSRPSSADGTTTSSSPGARSQPVRSPSGSAINSASSLLRTPTTEEWSRYLESQGVALGGRRSRSGTNFSSGSSAHRGHFALPNLSSSSKADLNAGAGDYEEDSDLDSDDSDDHHLGVEVMEKLKQLGLSRAASRAGSVLGDELGA